MKILQVNNVYAEKSTGKLTEMLHNGLLEAGHESVVVYGRGKTSQDQNIIRLCPEWYAKLNALVSRITGIPHGGCFFSTMRLKRIILAEKPDVVHLQCINEHFVNIYELVRWLKENGIKTVSSQHGEFMYTANCGYAYECNQWKHGCQQCPNQRKAVKSWFFDRTAESWRMMRDAFSGFQEKCIISPVSPWSEERAAQADIMKAFSFRTVYNGVNTRDVFHWSPNFEKKNMVLNVTFCFSLDKAHIKGGWYILQLAKRMPDVTFVVAGKAEEVPDCPRNLVLLGEVRDQNQLADLYRQASLTLMVSRRETFSMPCAESLCCGTPVVGFKAGAPEQISLPEYSEFVEHGDLDGLERAVRQWLERKDLDSMAIAKAANDAYSAETMVQHFVEIYRSIP